MASGLTFDENFVYGGEDTNFFHSVADKGRCVFAGTALVYHRQRERFWKVFLWGIRRGRAKFCIDCVQRGPTYSIIGKWRASFLPKISFLLMLCAGVTCWAKAAWPGLCLLGLASLCWSIFINMRLRV